jgi:hypothetical protein
MRACHVCRPILALLSLVALIGCTDASMSEVAGKVTVDGQAIGKGVIAFYPVDGKKEEGGAIVDGIYKVRVPVGLAKVTISMPKVVGTKKLYGKKDSPEYPYSKEALPEKYNLKSELMLDVPIGGIEKDWQLSSK